VFSLINNGNCDWSNDVELFCISGIAEGQSMKINSLKPGGSNDVQI
jgi:hypothetical protein